MTVPLDASTTSVASNSSAPPPAAVTLPIRCQCPLCFDVLRYPVLLPCCKRHLCMECFERALALTSANCGFCRKRIVGFARKKQNKVDNALWNEILARCPFLGAAMISGRGSAANDMSWSINFIDEQAPSRQSSETDPQELKPGELKQFYEQRVRERQSQLEHEEALALEKTMDFLQSDPEYLASLASQKAAASTVSATAIPALSSFHPRTGSGTKHHRSPSPVDKVTAPPAKQQRLDTFFASTVDLTSIPTSSPVRNKNQSHIAQPLLEQRELHSSPRHRKPTAAIQTTLFQRMLASSNTNSTPRGGGLTSKITPSDKRKPPKAKPPTDQTRRTPWRCIQCTFENTCFDRQCSMCHSTRPPPLSS